MRMTERRDLNDETRPFFTPGFEAFIVTQMENNNERWTERAKWHKKNNDWTAHLPKKNKKVKGEEPPANPCHDGKFSINDGGQGGFESWSEAGLEFFNTTYMAIVKERKDNGDNYVKFERQFVKYLQEQEDSAVNTGSKRTISEVNPEGNLAKAQKRAHLVVEDEDEGDLGAIEIDLNNDNLSVAPEDPVMEQGGEIEQQAGNNPVDGDNDSQPSQQSQQIADPELAEGETEE